MKQITKRRSVGSIFYLPIKTGISFAKIVIEGFRFTISYINARKPSRLVYG